MALCSDIEIAIPDPSGIVIKPFADRNDALVQQAAGPNSERKTAELDATNQIQAFPSFARTKAHIVLHKRSALAEKNNR